MNKYEKTKEMIEYSKLGVLPCGTMSADKLDVLPYRTMSADKLDVIDDDEETPEQVEENKSVAIKKMLKRTAKMRRNLFTKVIETVNMPNHISQLEGCIQYIETEKKKNNRYSLGRKKRRMEQRIREGN